MKEMQNKVQEPESSIHVLSNTYSITYITLCLPVWKLTKPFPFIHLWIYCRDSTDSLSIYFSPQRGTGSYNPFNHKAYSWYEQPPLLRAFQKPFNEHKHTSLSLSPLKKSKSLGSNELETLII